MTKSIVERRQANASDEQFMRKLHKAAYYDVIVRQFGGWDDELQASLFSKKWRPEQFEILELDGQPIGCIRIEDRSDEVFLAEIQILPDFQSRGIGREVIQGEVARAHKMKKPIRLQVLKKNERARALYERLGFGLCGTTDRHFILSKELG
jgi:ribosomal protein S18 acetylase RimI-like enzyme